MSTTMESSGMTVETEVVAKAQRRRFTAADKLRVLRKAARCTKPPLGLKRMTPPPWTGTRMGLALPRPTLSQCHEPARRYTGGSNLARWLSCPPTPRFNAGRARTHRFRERDGG